MTGVLGRLRAWLGTAFGGDGAGEDDGEGGDGSGAVTSGPERSDTDHDGGDRRVVYRDDRPLETPNTLDGTDDAADTLRPGRVAVPDAEDGSATTPTEGSTTDHPPVSIPDAEGGSPPETTSPAGTEAAADDPESRSVDGMGDSGQPPDADREGGNDGFACSVCGTAIDDPNEPCPLCRSTDVVSLADGAAAEAAQDRRSRPSTSTSTGDDDAVDRLRDLRDGE